MLTATCRPEATVTCPHWASRKSIFCKGPLYQVPQGGSEIRQGLWILSRVLALYVRKQELLLQERPLDTICRSQTLGHHLLGGLLLSWTLSLARACSNLLLSSLRGRISLQSCLGPKWPPPVLTPQLSVPSVRMGKGEEGDSQHSSGCSLNRIPVLSRLQSQPSPRPSLPEASSRGSLSHTPFLPLSASVCSFQACWAGFGPV